MSEAAIVNQLITVFNLCIFMECPALNFTAQYYGSGDEEGTHTLCLKLMVVAV